MADMDPARILTVLECLTLAGKSTLAGESLTEVACQFGKFFGVTEAECREVLAMRVDEALGIVEMGQSPGRTPCGAPARFCSYPDCTCFPNGLPSEQPFR